jgi:SNF2 family DNA or RNA helicase
MKLSLLPYQSEAVDVFFASDAESPHKLFWSDAGTGKTPIALRAAEMVTKIDKRPMIYLTIKACTQQVIEEVVRFTEMDAIIVEGTPEQRKKIWGTIKLDNRIDLYITSYESLLADIALLKPYEFSLVIADECQKIMSPVAKSTKAMKKIKAHRRLAMSGTPVMNKLHELWSVHDWLRPGEFYRCFSDFRHYECTTNPYIPQQITGYRDEQKLRAVFDKVTHRIRGSVVLHDLPEYRERESFVSLSDADRVRYETLKKEAVLELAGGERQSIPNVLSCLTRLRQLVDCPEVIGAPGPSSKETEAINITKQWLAEDKENRVIIFSEFSSAAKRIAEKLGAPVISGDTKTRDRRQTLESYARKEIPVIVCTAAGQTGLNMQAANKILSYGVPWNHARLVQRIARAHRRGQEREVEHVILLAKNTVDEHMYKLVRTKEKLNKNDLIEMIL